MRMLRLLQAARRFSTGPAASKTLISDELLGKLKSLTTQSIIDGLWAQGWPTTFIEGARPLAAGQKMAGRAVTLRFVPQRPDIALDKPAAEASPEYEAFEKCGPQEVIVMASVGPWESVGGDIKFLRLMQKGVAGLVTDGSVRDTGALLGYGFPVYSHSTTAKQGPHAHQPWECDGVISCGGVVVRPGDAIVGDQDGAVVVPAAVAQKVYEIAYSREQVEEVVKEELEKNPGPPGRYYPFMSGKIALNSPLSGLLKAKGLDPSKYYTTNTHNAALKPYGVRHRETRTYSARHYTNGANSKYMRSQADMAEVFDFIGSHKATAVLRTPTAAAAPKAMDAAIAGGFKICEFTLTTPGCLHCVAEYAPRKDIMVGCGTVMNIPDAQAAMDAGARFLVSPCLVEDVILWAAKHNIVIIPGCATPTELYKAYTLGAPIQKLFPGVANGPTWVKAVSAALPMLKINPTSGVELATAAEYLRSGANSLGFVAPLFDAKDIGKEDWGAIQAKAVDLMSAVNSA